MKTKVAQISNVRAMMVAHEALLKRPSGMPGIAIVHGPSGFGKTTAVRWLANRVNAIFVNAVPLWTPRWMLSDLMRELAAQPTSSCQPMFEFIARALRENPRPIVIDEADYIAKRDVLVETLRTLHDLTSVPMLLVGMAEFKKRAAHRPQLHRRIIREVEFKPASAADAQTLADELCELTIHSDLVGKLHARSGGSVGLLVNQLAEAEAFARRHRLSALKLADYLGDADEPVRANVKAVA